MNSLLLITTLLSLTLQSVLRKQYTVRTGGNGVYTYTVLSGIGTLIFFLVTSKDLNFQPGILPYAVWFAASYILAGIFGLKATAEGSLSLTSLIVNCALIIPTLYGLIFLKEPGSIFLYIGIAFLFVAMILVNKTSETMPITWKWLLYVTIAFAGNGMCSVSQKIQQDAFEGAGKNELMIIALGIVVVVNAALMIATDRKQLGVFFKSGWANGLLAGSANGVVNLFVMIMLGLMPASVVFPLISGGSIVLTYAVSRVFYKEKLSLRQTVGFLFGILSIVLLNL